MLLQEARAGFLFSQQVKNNSEKTLEYYLRMLMGFEHYIGGTRALDTITKNDVMAFMAMLQGKSVLFDGSRYHPSLHKKYSPHTVDDYFRTLRTFWKWACAEKMVEANPMNGVQRPTVPVPIKPRFSEDEIRRLLKACKSGSEGLAMRNQAMLLFMLDTGARAREVCSLTLDRLDKDVRRAQVIGKGARDRYLPIGARTREVMWRYIHVFRPEGRGTNAVFLTARGGQLNANKLAHILDKIGKRAGVACNAHKFRHTAARLFLHNGGNAYALQELLGHASLETVRHYLRNDIDELERVHERASPVDRLVL